LTCRPRPTDRGQFCVGFSQAGNPRTIWIRCSVWNTALTRETADLRLGLGDGLRCSCWNWRLAPAEWLGAGIEDLLRHNAEHSVGGRLRLVACSLLGLCRAMQVSGLILDRCCSHVARCDFELLRA
jgi:hypothetical protein